MSAIPGNSCVSIWKALAVVHDSFYIVKSGRKAACNEPSAPNQNAAHTELRLMDSYSTGDARPPIPFEIPDQEALDTFERLDCVVDRVIANCESAREED